MSVTFLYCRERSSKEKPIKEKKKKTVLDCGKSVNLTQFDHLRGVADRQSHAHIPEPEVAMIFRKKNSRSAEVDMDELEKKLKKAKREASNPGLSSEKKAGEYL